MEVFYEGEIGKEGIGWFVGWRAGWKYVGGLRGFEGGACSAECSVEGRFFPGEDGTWTLEFTSSGWDLLETGTIFSGFSK